MLNPAVLLLGLVVSQPGIDPVDVPEEAPIPSTAPAEGVVESALPIAPLPMTEEEDANGEEISPLERQPRERRGIPAWGWNNAADGWYPSTRHMEPYIEPHFGNAHHHPYWSWHHWWRSPGDMVQHLAYYPTLHSYYYARPYHPMQLPHHSGVADSYGLDPRNPYDNSIFEKVYESLREEKAARQETLELIEPTP